MADEKSLQGWMPTIGGEMTLERIIDLAFDYRGNTTIVKGDGSEVTGYLFNRNKSAKEPFIQYFDEQGNGPFTLPYSQIKTIKFTGKDMAAGNSYAAYLERKKRQQETGATAPLNAAEEEA
ncbi:MAG: hypothetical protein FJ039_09295 [Chloroflexi bacterium]|nr:hypothetical protein [Chloroflexota bacterium]